LFISDTHLPQALPADAYKSPEQYQREMERLFLPSWHFIGAVDDAPNDGDYFTCDLLGRPLIVWNKDGELHTFLNVCPHRFTTLRNVPSCGHMDRLHCQYHGWEFDEHGDTKRIPDAKSFRPMEKGALGLKKVRTEVVGNVIYINLSDDGPTLEEQIGPGYATAQRLFSRDRRLFLTYEYDVEANWKIKVENTLESYHIALIHPETFKNTPDERICEHEIDPRFTTFRTSEPPPKKIDLKLNQMVHAIAGVPFKQEYKHFLYYPAVMMVETGLITVAESVFPTGPHSSKVLLKFFVYTGKPGALASKALFHGIRWWGRKFFVKVALEDAGILPAIQKGLDSPVLPSEGLISIREERLYHFQEYIRRATSDEDSLEHADAWSATSKAY
jgi:phenylpropionate dioxygenase-like ring-hydroxylating dioxygenase large terminal subunit